MKAGWAAALGVLKGKGKEKEPSKFQEGSFMGLLLL